MVNKRILDKLGHPVRQDNTPSPAKEDEISSVVLFIRVVVLYIHAPDLLTLPFDHHFGGAVGYGPRATARRQQGTEVSSSALPTSNPGPAPEPKGTQCRVILRDAFRRR